MSRDNEEKKEYDLIGYATLMYGDMFGDGFYSDIPYVLQAMRINFSYKIPDIVLDIRSYKCTSQEICKECSICLEKINEGDNLCTIDCAHTFHFKCIMEWGKYKRECPLCRTEIPVLKN